MTPSTSIRTVGRHGRRRGAHSLAGAILLVCAATASVYAQPRPARFLAREDILLYGLGLKVEPATQTVPKDIATIVSTYLQAPTLPDGLPPFAPDAEVHATLAGPSFATPRELVVRPNSPFEIPPLTVGGIHTLENIRLISGGEVLLYGSPQSVRIEVIERLLVTQVTARPLSAAEIREKGIVFDQSSFQAYNFSAAFAVEDKKINLNFPVLLPTLQGAGDEDLDRVTLQQIPGPQLQTLKTIIPDTLRIQTQIPNLTVVGFTLKAPDVVGQQLIVPPIPGVIVIPGDIGFLNQFFSVMLMVGNVAPEGSNLVVSDLRAEIVLPPGRDGTVPSGDDPLRMAQNAAGEAPRVQAVVQAGLDGRLGTADDIATIGPGETGNAEYLVEGLREGSHVVEMQISGILHGLPVGPVPITGRAAGSVLVRNPTFTLTFTHPEVVSAGEPYTLDVTVTNTSPSPANFVTLNLYPRNVSGATIVGESSRQIESIPPADSATVTFDLIATITGKVTAATLDSLENVAGRFELKAAVGELGVPLSPDSLVLPKEAGTLPASLRSAAIGLLGKAWAVATAPAAALPKDIRRFSRKIVIDRAIEVAEAGLRISLHEPLPDSVAQLEMDFAGSNVSRLEELVQPGDVAFERDNYIGFDELRRRSIRGDVFATAVAALLADRLIAEGAVAFHAGLAQKWSYRPAHFSALLAANGAPAPYDLIVADAQGRQLGGVNGDGKIIKDVPFADLLSFADANASNVGQLALVARPEPGGMTVRLRQRAGASPDTTTFLSLVVPNADGTMRQVVYQLAEGEIPASIADPQFPIAFELIVDGAPVNGSPVPPISQAAVPDPPPAVISVIQQKDADQIRCDPGTPGVPAGRVVAVLFSEEVTPASVQDRLAADKITGYTVEENRVVGVALQPGRRIAFLALRDGVGPFVQRHIEIAGASDRRGQTMAPWYGPIEITVSDEAAIVSGRVMNADGTPVPFADVRLFYLLECGDQPRWVGISAKHTDADGHYSWDYVVRRLPDRILAVDPATGDFRNVRFQVQRNGQHLNVDVVFLGRGTVRGVARSETGQLLGGTSVRITSFTDQSQYGALTDTAGRFEIGRVPVGNVLIEAVNVSAHAQGAFSDYVPFAGAVVERDITLFDVEQRKITVKHGTIRGHVYREDGTTPAARAPVFVFYKTQSQEGVTCPPASDPCPIASATTDPTGAFEFVDVTSGQLTLRTFDQAGLSQGEVGLVLAPDETRQITILLSGGLGTVQGRVIDADGNPVAGAQVGGGLTLTTTNAQGEFTLDDVPVGHREIVAVSQSLKSSGRVEVDLLRAGETIGATIVLAGQGAISGVVVKADGTTPVAGNKVYAFRAGTAGGYEVVGYTTTNLDGGYRIEPVPLGKFTVSAFGPGFADGNLAPAEVKYNHQTVKADIRFRGGNGRVIGTVFDDDGKTPLKARVGVSGDRVKIAGGIVGVAFEHVQYFAVTDTDLTTGRFQFNGLLVGAFTVSAAGQFSPDPVTVEGIIPEPGATVEMNLSLQSTSQVRGTVLQPDGVTPVGADVIIHYKSEEYKVICSGSGDETECTSIPQGIQETNVVTDSAGRFWFPVVNAGVFTLSVEDPASGRVAQVRGSVRPAETADVSIRLLSQADLAVHVLGSDRATSIAGAKVVVSQLGFPGRTLTRYAGPDGIALFVGADAFSEGDFVVEATDVTNGFAGRASGRIAPQQTEAEANVFLFDVAGSVHGQVVSSDGYTPVGNAELVVSNAQGPLAVTITASDGTYAVAQVPVGPFRVETFDPRTGRRGAGDGRIDLNGQDVPVNIVLSSIGMVTGTLLESGQLSPLKGWQITLTQESPSGVPLPTLVTTSGVDGRFSLPGAAQGAFTILAAKTGVSGSGHANGTLDREGQVVDVPVLATISRPLKGTVAGTVVSSTGVPIANAVVEICASCGLTPVVVTSEVDGTFSLADRPLGRFTVRAHSQTSNDAGGLTGELTSDGEISAVIVVMQSVATITGRVEYSNGSPASGAQVVFEGLPSIACSGNFCVQYANSDGRFTFVDQPTRSFTVTAIDASNPLLKGVAGGSVEPGQTKDLRIVLSPTAPLSGRVLTSIGQAAGGVLAELVYHEHTPSELRLFKETAADGTFSFAAAPLDQFVLYLTDPVGSGRATRTGQLTGPQALGDIVLDDAVPAVASVSPVASSIGVPRGQVFTIVFTEPILPGTITAQTVALSSASGAVVATLDVTANDTTVVLTPLQPLAAETRYTLRISGVKDRVAKPMAADYVAAFTTEDITPPSVVEFTPAPNTGGATIYTPIRVKYSEPIDPLKFSGPPIALSGPGGTVAGRLDYLYGNTVVVFTPYLPLVEDATYQVTVAPATDVAGVAQQVGSIYQFTTTDRTPPVIIALTADGNGTVIENGTTTVTASVGLTHDVLFVDFYLNEQLAFVDRAAPFVISFQAVPELGTPGSSITVSAIATDTSGNRGTDPISITVAVIADTPPVVAITTPAGGLAAKNGDRIVANVRATDDLGVTQIGYRALTGKPADALTRTVSPPLTDRTESFVFYVPADAPPGTAIEIQASATDTRGQRSSAAPVTINVLDATPPVVTITGATTGAQVAPGQQTTVVVTATDVGKIASIGFTASGVTSATEIRALTPALASAVTSFTVTVPTTAQPGQALTLDATATDVAGNSAAAARVILPVADAGPPTISLAPESGVPTAVPGRPVRIVATATDETAVQRIDLTASGAVTFSDSKQTPLSGSASVVFEIPIPGTAPAGATIEVRATAVDRSNNTSAPATLVLTIVSPIAVTLPPSEIVNAGETKDVLVQLGEPAPAGGVVLSFATSNPDVATVTPVLSFAEGETTRTVVVTGVAGGTTQIRALIQTVERATMTVTVQGGIVRGVVRDSLLNPVSSAQVTVSSGYQRLNATTDAEGRYVVFGAPGPFVSVRAIDPVTHLYGHTTAEMADPNGFATANLVLVPAGSIGGTVHEPDGTTVGAGVQVDIYAGTSNSPLATTFTDDTGAYEFPFVTLGSYVIEATTTGKRGRATATLDQSGQQLTVPVVFLGWGTITGVVRANGVPVGNATLKFENWTLFGQAPPIETNAEPDGTFTFSNVSLGSFTITAKDPSTGLGGTATGNLTLHLQTITADLNVAVFGAVQGVVYRADGTTIVARAKVVLSGNSSRQTLSDSQGGYRFDVVPLGDYTLRATDAATRGIGIGQVSVQASGGTSTADINMFPQGRLLLTVTTADGQPVSSAFLRIHSNNGSAEDWQSATTGVDGTVLGDHVLAGSFDIRATYGSLAGEVTGTLDAGELKNVTVPLEPTGTITGTILEADAQTPAAGVKVILHRPWLNPIEVTTGADGVYRAEGLQLARYDVTVRDTANRVRARTDSLDQSDDVVLAAPGEIATRDFTLIGLGSVHGTVVYQDGASAQNISVTLQSHAALFELTFGARTGAGGEYRIENVPVGPFSVSAGNINQQVYGESSGTLPSHGADVAADIMLTSNAVSLPQTNSDANNFAFDVQPDGTTANGSNYVFRGDGNANQGAFALELTTAGTITRIAGGEIPTAEDAGREFVVRQENVGGLSVTRKIFVPAAGYFARYLEVLRNPTSTPISVDVRVFGHVTGNVVATSSGDEQLDVSSQTTADGWATVGGNADTYTAAFVFDGAGAPVRAGAAAFSPLPGGWASFGRLEYAWHNITIEPGGAVALMHFGVQQFTRAAAIASAERLVQLPPEALSGLSADELTAIRNFAVPASGASSVPPLPALTGRIGGTVLEWDGTTPVPDATVAFKSSHVLFGGTYWTTANSTGAFTLQGSLSIGNSVPVPVYGFTLQGVYPSTSVKSTMTSATFPTGSGVAAANVVFSNTGGVTGVVRRHTGAAVASGTVLIKGGQPSTTRSAAIGADSRYRAGGLLAGDYTFTASVPDPKGTGISGIATATIVPGAPQQVDITLEPTGSLTGTVRRASGTLAGNVSVTVKRADFTRTTQTDTGGAFSFTDMPVGDFTVSATEPGTSITTSVSVSIAADQQTTSELTLIAVGSVTGTVRIASNNTIVAGVTVALKSNNPSAGGFSYATTNGAGVYTFAAVPQGTFSVTVNDTARQLFGEAAGQIDADGQQVTANISLINNAVNLPTNRFDASNFFYQVQQNGSIGAGTNAVFGYLSSDRGADYLEIDAGAGPVKFTGAAAGTHEDSTREIAVRQTNIAGLNVTRKIFVPRRGYFARVLDVLNNPTDQPVTVTVRLRSQVGIATWNWGYYYPPLSIVSTSSGDTQFVVAADDATDRWIVIDDANPADPFESTGSAPALAFAFDGEGARENAAAASYASSQGGLLSYEWQHVTIPAGASAAYMHFVVQQTSRDGAIASAQRLAQLPPEALEGLGADEIAAIRNFNVPANGISTVAALPSLTGAVSGRVLASDLTTTIGSIQVTFRSANALFGRKQSVWANAQGNFTFTGVINDSGSSAPVPVDGFTLSGKHPDTSVTATAAGSFAAGSSSTTRDLVFTGTANLDLLVTFANGLAAPGVTVVVMPEQMWVTTGADGHFRRTGFNPGSHTIYAYRSATSPQAGDAVGVSQAVTFAADQTASVTLAFPAWGSVTGTLRNGGGNVVQSQQVTARAQNFSRNVSTDANGVFTLTELPVGQYVLQSYEPRSNALLELPVTILSDQVVEQDLTFLGVGSVTVQVNFARGVPAPNSHVSIQHAGNGGGAGVGYTDAAGQIVIPNVPAGPFTVTAQYPNSWDYPCSGVGTLTREGESVAITLTLQPLGAVTGKLTRASGVAVPWSDVELHDAETGDYLRSDETNSSGTFGINAVPLNEPFYLLVDHPSASWVTKKTETFTLTADGEVKTFDLVLPAIATVRVTALRPDGTPWSGLRVESRDAARPYFELKGYTNASGQIDLSEMAEGSFTVRLRDTATGGLYAEQIGTINPADDGAIVNFEMAVSTFMGTVSGHVFAADRVTPVPRAAIAIVDATDNRTISSMTTAADGAFEFASLLAGPKGFVVSAQAPNDPAMKVQQTGSIPSAGATVLIDLVLPVTVGNITGTVVAGDGVTPVPGASVAARDASSNSGPVIAAGADGSFQFSNVAFGSAGFKVIATAFGASSIPQVENFPAQGATVAVTITLPLVPGSVQGTVYAGDGVTPLPNTWVSATAGPAYLGGVSADQNGHFTLGPVYAPAAGFTISAERNNRTASVTVVFPSPNASVNADLVLPLSVLKGRVTFADGAPVPNPNVFVEGSDLMGRWADTKDSNGNYLVLGTAPGPALITAQVSSSGLTRQRQVDIPGAASNLTVDITMPGTGSVSGHAYDKHGNALASVWLWLRSASLQYEQSVGTDSTGAFTFSNVPEGPFTIGGDYRDGATSKYVNIAAAGNMTAGATLTLDVNPLPAGAVVATLKRADGTAVGSADVELVSFNAVQRIDLYGTTDANGTVTFSDVPAGSVYLTGYDPNNWDIIGRSEGIVVAGETTAIEVILGNAVWLNRVLEAPGSFRYEISCDGEIVSGGIGSSVPSPYNWSYWLDVGDDSFWGSCAAQLSPDGRQLSLGPEDVAELAVSRKIYVPENGSFARYLETITNTSGYDRLVKVYVGVYPLSGYNMRWIVTPSDTGRRYAAADDGNAGAPLRPALGFVMAGKGAVPVPVNGVEVGGNGSRNFAYQWLVNVPAGGSVSFMHFALQRMPDDASGAQAAAEALSSLTDPNALTGLTAAEKAQIRNFIIPQP